MSDMSSVPLSLLMRREEHQLKKKPLNNFQNASFSVKLALLLESGHWDPQMSIPIEPVGKTTPVMLTNEHISMYSVLVQ